MKKAPSGPPAVRDRKMAHRERILDQALAESSPASDPPAMIGPGGREVLDREDDA